MSEVILERNGQPAQPIVRYPDEPHPDNEWEWKCWWIKRFYQPDQILTQGDLVFAHQCWIETKARWCVPADNDKKYCTFLLDGQITRVYIFHQNENQRPRQDRRPAQPQPG